MSARDGFGTPRMRQRLRNALGEPRAEGRSASQLEFWHGHRC